MILDQWHVLVGRRVQHHLNVMIRQYAPHLSCIGDRTQNRHNLNFRVFSDLAQLHVDFVQRDLAQLEQHHLCRAALHDLPAQL